jgi:hypothetical protein
VPEAVCGNLVVVGVKSGWFTVDQKLFDRPFGNRSHTIKRYDVSGCFCCNDTKTTAGDPSTQHTRDTIP